MTTSLKSDNFTIELSYIKDERIRENAKIILDLLPNYFYEVPATSSGKYHPEFAQGDGGLIRHTKAAVRIAKEILDLEFSSENFTNNEKDLILLALLIHDGLKSGLEYTRYTRFEHPILISKFVIDNRDKTTLKDEELEFITRGIESHMGEWNTNPYTRLILPKPETKAQRLIHMCDCLSSKKFLNIEFDEENNMKNLSKHL